MRRWPRRRQTPRLFGGLRRAADPVSSADAGFWLLKLLGIAPTAAFNSPGRWAATVTAIDAGRSARNNSIGHPVRRDKSGPLASFFIVQSSLGADGFRLLESDEHGTGRFSSVSTARLATEQLESICWLLEDAARQLDVVAIEALQQLRSKGALLIGARRYLQLKLGLVNAAAPMGGQSLRELRRSARSLLAQRCRARSRHCMSRPLSTQRQCKLSRCHYRTSGKRSSEGLFLRQSLLG